MPVVLSFPHDSFGGEPIDGPQTAVGSTFEADMLKTAGVRHLVLCDSKGVVRPDRADLIAFLRTL